MVATEFVGIHPGLTPAEVHRMALGSHNDKALHALGAIRTEQREHVAEATRRMARCVAHDRIVHTFGTGRSSRFPSEGRYRAGGLACANAMPVELTIERRTKDLETVSVTSRDNACIAPPSGGGGLSLAAVADHVIDDHVSPVDAFVSMSDTGRSVCALSTLVGAFVWSALVAEGLSRLASRGWETPAYVNGNREAAKEVSDALVKGCWHRIRSL